MSTEKNVESNYIRQMSKVNHHKKRIVMYKKPIAAINLKMCWTEESIHRNFTELLLCPFMILGFLPKCQMNSGIALWL